MIDIVYGLVRHVRSILLAIVMLSLFGSFSTNRKQRAFRSFENKLFPVIKAGVPDGADTAGSVTLSPEQIPVARNIAGDLACLYGIDRGSYFELLQQGQVPPEMDTQLIDSLAQANLTREVDGKVELHQIDVGRYMMTCGGEYEAALITLPMVWETVVATVGPRVVFAVPSKDVFVFASAIDSAQVEPLLELIEKIHQGRERLLSKRLFHYQDGMIEPR